MSMMIEDKLKRKCRLFCLRCATGTLAQLPLTYRNMGARWCPKAHSYLQLSGYARVLRMSITRILWISRCWLDSRRTRGPRALARQPKRSTAADHRNTSCYFDIRRRRAGLQANPNHGPSRYARIRPGWSCRDLRPPRRRVSEISGRGIPVFALDRRGRRKQQNRSTGMLD